jgi:hypothetical protein
VDWEELFSLPAAVTPQEAHHLGVMVAAMVNASLAKVVEDSVGVNVESFRRGLQEGLAENGLDITTLLLEPVPLDPATLDLARLTDGEAGQSTKPSSTQSYVVPVPWNVALH